MIKQEAKQEKDWVQVFYLDGIMIVPHYIKEDVYVLPGGKEVSSATLLEHGAFQSASYLWPRLCSKNAA